MPPANSATGTHEMFNLFLDAAGAEVTITGRRWKGTVMPRGMAGRKNVTAFLAFSETRLEV